MAATKEIDWAFFDIGGTLGERHPTTGNLIAYSSSAGLLQTVRNVLGLRVGIITTLGPSLTNADAMELLTEAGLAAFVDPIGLISEHDAGAAKPQPAIYQFAADKVASPVGRCLFVGENLIEVMGALTAGMQALLKPCPPGRDLPS